MQLKQRIYKVQYSHRTYSNTRIDGELIGLTPKKKVYVFEKEDTLLYTHDRLTPTGYTIYKVQKVEGCADDRSQVTIPADWIKKYSKDLTHVKVDYTEIGIIISSNKEGI